MSRLIIQSISPASSVQDFGRFGLQRFGLTTSGAMDRQALAMANALVGQPVKSAGIEIGPMSSRFAAQQGDIRMACAGAARRLAIDGQPVEMDRSFVLRAGENLDVSVARPGVFTYISVEGGIKGEPSFGSLSVTARAGIGSPFARPLQAGDDLETQTASSRDEFCISSKPMGKGPIRVVLGPQDDYFEEDQIERFFSTEWRVSMASDRMGYRMDGPPLAHRKGFNIISDGIVNGHIQIPGNGLPLVLLADRGTTGGYPKIGAIITADLGRFAQTEVACAVRFERIGIGEAQRETVRYLRAIADLPAGLIPVNRAMTSESLMSANIVGGVVHALDGVSWAGYHAMDHATFNQDIDP